MNSLVSYGELRPAFIGALDVIFRYLLNAPISPATVQRVDEVIEFADSGVWGDEPIDPTSDFRVFRVSDFSGDFQLDLNSPPYRSIPERQRDKFRLKRGDILVVKSSGSAKQVVSGRVAVFNPDSDRPYAASNFLLRLRPLAQVDPYYLSYALGSPLIRETIADQVKTMTYPNLSFKLYRELLVPLLPLSEQLQVAEFLQAFLLRRPLPDLPNYLRDVRQAVSRIEALCGKIEEAQSLRLQSEREAAALITSLHVHLAKGRTVRIGAVLSLTEDQEEVRPGDLYPQVGVRSFGKGLFAKSAIDATQTTYRAFNRLHEGALVLSQVKGWEGAVAVCARNLAGMFVSPEYRTFECVPGQLLPEYLASIVPTPWFWTQLAHVTRGVGARRERTRPEQFLNLEMLMPTEENQRRALRILERIRALSEIQRTTTPELDTLMAAVLSKAISGDL